jgi:hypothetical protein
VATYSTGISVTFDGVAFSEVSELSWEYGGNQAKGRDSAWTDEVGTVTVGCMGTANISTAKYGTRADLSITGGGAALTCKAVYEGLSVAPEFNGVTRYTVTLRLLDG